MAAYLALRDKKTGEIYEKAALIEIDNKLCQYLGVEPTDNWHNDWMNWVGFAIAYRSDKSIKEALTPMYANARQGEKKLLRFFIDRYENASYHGW